MSLIETRRHARLMLQDGTEFRGFAFGHEASVTGEVVFQTGMTGYIEDITDPSYSRQILALTYPMIGNYGIPDENEVDANGILVHLESSRIQVAALVVDNLAQHYSHHTALTSLSAWMKLHRVPGIYGIDTRALAKKLRVNGCIPGKVVMEGEYASKLLFEDVGRYNLVDLVSTKDPRTYNEGGAVKILVVDVGLKLNQLRCLIARGACVKVVPWSYDFTKDVDFDGLFITNGPGDPSKCLATITHLQEFLSNPSHKPVFCHCLGNQLLALALGAKTVKLSYGNRGHNQPCIHEGTKRCFITSQNHGFAVDISTLPKGWKPLFTNADDGSNEGIIHESRPVFSVQFHPEARAGPEDTLCLFDAFINRVKAFTADPLTSMATYIDRALYPVPVAPVAEVSPTKVLILGSGGLTIGQAGEFDYAGSQAIKALKEEGIRTVLVNPNIATVQTMRGLADQVYFLPVTPEYVESVIIRERPDGILLSFGGQTALNCGCKLYENGVLAKYDVKVLGTPINAIISTEDRKMFSEKLQEIGEFLNPNISCSSIAEVVQASKSIGFPIVLRSSFALGGMGSGICADEAALIAMASNALANSPQVIVEKSLFGWKELTYEIVRDAFDNVISVCNMESFDPCGIHTGDSIVVTPSQTINDREHNMLRTSACKVVRHLGIIGVCNVLFALDPHSMQYYIIEVNARMSRSSALASKATGYPLAHVATKLSLNRSLCDLRNAVTKKTTACFEPSLDYCVVKIPRWDISKFHGASNQIGTSMKSVGEVLSIGRSFEEAFQKALRMLDRGYLGFEAGVYPAFDEALAVATDVRPFVIATALKRGYTVERLNQLTNIDSWFLHKCRNIIEISEAISKTTITTLSRDLLLHAKQAGFGDAQIAKLIASDDLAVRFLRKSFGVFPFVKQIDTVAAYHQAQAHYLYHTYNGCTDDVAPTTDSVLVLGSGVYHIGSSVEFDYCAVGCVRECRRLGVETIVINCNPETVSTDFDECDRLYFEELSFETVIDIYEREQPRGMVLSMGGQIPNNLAVALSRENVCILGTSPDMIDNAENRLKFSRLCDLHGLDQPLWKELSSFDEAKQFAEQVKYPVLIRPSYISSGSSMRVAHDAAELRIDFGTSFITSHEYPVVISKFHREAKEVEVDAVAKNGEVVAMAISEHVENAGVHSGDASIMHPPQTLSTVILEDISTVTSKIANMLKISGPFNIQFLCNNEYLKVIECNLRASRSFPFVSKTTGIDFIAIATQVMLGRNPVVAAHRTQSLVGVKVAQFSFNRLPGANPTLGVDMMSTGEVACFGSTKEEAFLKAIQASGIKLPQNSIYISLPDAETKLEFLKSVRILSELRFALYGSVGTAAFYASYNIPIKAVNLPSLPAAQSAIVDALNEMLVGKIDLVINAPSIISVGRPTDKPTAGYYLRCFCINRGISLLTNVKSAIMFVEALRTVPRGPSISSIDCQSSWDTVTWSNTICGLIKVTEESIVDTLSAVTAAGFTSAIVVSNYPISPSINNVACNFACLYGGDDLEDLSSIQQQFSGIFMNLEENSSTKYSPEIVSRVFEIWPKNKPIVVHASDTTLSSVGTLAFVFGHPVHFIDVKSISDLHIIDALRQKGVPVSASVSIFECAPTAASAHSFIQHLHLIDAFDNGHSLAADSLDTAIPLLLNICRNHKVPSAEISKRVTTGPAHIYGLQPQANTFVQIETNYPNRSETLLGRPMFVEIHGVAMLHEGHPVDVHGSGVRLELDVQPGINVASIAAADDKIGEGVSLNERHHYFSIDSLLEKNRRWAADMRRKDPLFFSRLANIQTPEYLWIGCSDSRVPANQIISLNPGEIFVHRNVANVVVHTDLNVLSVVQYAVDVLKVKHILVVGHYGCGGVKAAYSGQQFGLIDNWLRHVQDVKEKHLDNLLTFKTDHERIDRLCELNVIEQVMHVANTTIVRAAWDRGQEVAVHGLCYRLDDGILHNLGMSCKNAKQLKDLYQTAIGAMHLATLDDSIDL